MLVPPKTLHSQHGPAPGAAGWGQGGQRAVPPTTSGQGLSSSNLHFLFPSQAALVKLVGRSS